MMEYATGDWAKEQSHMGATIKTEEETADTSTAYIDIEIDLNHLKHEPESVQSVESEPAILVKKEIAENSNEDVLAQHIDDSEQQCAQSASIPADAASVYDEANSRCQDDWINVKPELEEMEIGPTVLQHMDIHYALNKSTVDACNKEMRYSEVKENVEDKLRDSLTPQEAMKKERSRVLQSLQHSVQERHLAACSVHVMKLNVFQCDLCHTVYAEKRKLLLHLQVVPMCRPQTTLVVKFRKTNKQTAADEKVTAQNRGQITTKVDYDETPMKSHLGQQKYLQKHLQQQHTTSSNSFKCDRTFHKPHLLVERNKLHQRDNRDAVTTTCPVAGPSNQCRDKSTKTKQKPFACKVCEKTYFSKVDFNLHKRSHSKVELKNNLVNYKSHTRKKPYRCDEKFAHSGDLTEYVRVHADEKPFQCKICVAKFAQSSSLTQHIRVHTGEKPFQCNICDAKFAQSSNLTKHIRVHTGEKPFLCKICDARFTQSHSLTQHKRVHTGEKPFQCKICDVRFTQRGSLTQHVRVHTGEKSFQCKICDARFVKNSYLIDHMRVHTGEKPYECDFCHARSATRRSLIQHMRVHTGEKPFQCKICDVRFTQSSSLTQHLRVHTGKKPFQCKICDARFLKNCYLTDHMRVHTGEKPYECDFCHARLAIRRSLIRHLRVHTGK